MALPHRIQDLAPEHARFCLRVQRFMTEELSLDLRGARIVVGFSGGVDSTVLLAALSLLSRRLECTVTAAHLDHRLRAESAEDAAHARRTCEAWGIPFTHRRVDVRAMAGGASGMENAARSARYAFLEEVRADGGADFIALGHTLDDLGEDVLMRQTRGAGWPQLGGMRAVVPERHVIRPLLLTTRAQIEGFATGLALPWVEDATNADTAYTRNRFRHDILPRLTRENPNFLGSIAEQWRLARLDADFFATQVSAALSGAEQNNGTIFLRREIIEDTHKALRLRIFKAALERLGPGQSRADALHRLDALFLSREGGKTVQFPGGKTATCSAAGVLLKPRCG